MFFSYSYSNIPWFVGEHSHFLCWQAVVQAWRPIGGSPFLLQAQLRDRLDISCEMAWWIRFGPKLVQNRNSLENQRKSSEWSQKFFFFNYYFSVFSFFFFWFFDFWSRMAMQMMWQAPKNFTFYHCEGFTLPTSRRSCFRLELQGGATGFLWMRQWAVPELTGATTSFSWIELGCLEAEESNQSFVSTPKMQLWSLVLRDTWHVYFTRFCVILSTKCFQQKLSSRSKANIVDEPDQLDK